MAFAIIGGITGAVCLFCVAFLVPFFIRRLEKEEDLKWYHIFYIHFVPTQPHDANIDAWLNQTLTPHVLDSAEKGETQVEQSDSSDVSPKELQTVSSSSSVNTANENGESSGNEGKFIKLNDTGSAAFFGKLNITEIKDQKLPFFEKIKLLLYRSIFMDVASVQRESAAGKAHEAAVVYPNNRIFVLLSSSYDRLIRLIRSWFK